MRVQVVWLDSAVLRGVLCGCGGGRMGSRTIIWYFHHIFHIFHFLKGLGPLHVVSAAFKFLRLKMVEQDELRLVFL